MQKWDDLEELEALGDTPEEGMEEEPQDSYRGGGLGTVPLLQALVCALALAGLLYLKQTGHPAYGAIAERYRAEAAQELHLPDWQAPSPQKGTPTPAPSPAPTEAPTGLPDIEVQRL